LLRRLVLAKLGLSVDRHGVDLVNQGRRAIEPLLAQLAHVNRDRRATAAEALGKMADAAALDPLVSAMLNDNDWLTRSRAAKALEQIGDARALEPLLVALEDKDSSVRGSVILALGQLGGPAAVERLMAELTGPGLRESEPAAKALAQIGEPSIRPLLAVLGHLGWKDYLAIDTLVKIGGPSVEPLIAMLGTADLSLRGEIAFALGRIGDPRAIDSLAAALNGRDGDVRHAAAFALARIGGAATETLLQALRSEEAGVRAAATSALAGADGRAIAALQTALDDVDAAVREAAVKALARTESALTTERLVKLVRDDPATGVRTAAIEALGKAADQPASDDLLIDLLRDRDPSLRAAAATALARPDNSGAVEPLISLLVDADDRVLTSAISALAEIGDERAFVPLVELGDRAATTLRAISLSSRSYLVHRVMERISRPAFSLGSRSDLPRGHVPERVPTPATEVDLATFHPKEVRLDRWYTLLAYVHVRDMRDAVERDSQVRGDPGVRHRSIYRPSRVDIARGAEIAIVPDLSGFVINPAVERIMWLEDWHRVDFRIQANPANGDLQIDAATNGHVSFYVEGLLAGEVPISIYVSEEANAEEELASRQSSSASLFQSIFASYSHDDALVVDRLSRAYRAIGNRFLRDVESLRSGVEWKEEILSLIEQADVFQLFWSQAAKQSPHVEKEWRHALERARPAFIRPIFWQVPMPEPPPELAGIHFQHYPFDSPGR
jgi:HEAT repeat protein